MTYIEAASAPGAAPPGGEAGRSASWRERGATLAVFLALGLCTGTWAAAIPALKDELGLDPGRLSLVLLAIAIASVFSTLTAGVVVHRIGTGRASAIAATITVIGFAMPGLASSFTQFLLAGLVLGAGAGALEVAVNGHASDIEERWGATIMSSFHAAFSLGGLVGAVLGGLVAAAGAGAQGQLWIPLLAAALLVAGAVFHLGAGARGGPDHGPALRFPGGAVLMLGLVATLCYLLEGAMADWSALYLTGIAGASVAGGAAGYAAFSITMAAGRLTGDWLVARLGPGRLVTGGALIGAAGFALAVLAPQPIPAAIGFALVGIGVANVVPLTFSAAARVAATPALGIAIVSTMGFGGFLGGPPLIGAVATWFGLRTSFAVLLGIALVVALIAPHGRRREA